jgi:hypothetical protein
MSKEKIFVTTEAGERVVAVAAITSLDWSEKEVVDEDGERLCVPRGPRAGRAIIAKTLTSSSLS